MFDYKTTKKDLFGGIIPNVHDLHFYHPLKMSNNNPENDPDNEVIENQNDIWYQMKDLEIDKKAVLYLSFISINKFSRRKVIVYKAVLLSLNN